MLKRLELVGFKSFADKTRFDFPAGITAIVGPNGSGKSNIVDAVRWTLGEQSAKSLRGGEMADVIFNGSTSRRSLGMAEVALTFDNSQRGFATEADEVCIARRVYRDGESEYLINHQPCRLRDIKEFFLGTGAGTDAYSVIEQGKVDVLLQASTRERRTIFEEAAGISRFKAKKIETLRKLERVDQNLERVKDIVEEVEKQLRSVKLQAAKAQRHQEYAGRLRELRIALGLDEFQKLSERLTVENEALGRIREGLDQRSSQLLEWEDLIRNLESAIERLDASLHVEEDARNLAAQQIAAAETTLSHERSLQCDLQSSLETTRVHLQELRQRVEILAAEASGAEGELTTVEFQSHEQRERARVLDDELTATVQRLSELQTQVQSDKVEHLERMRQAARLHNDAVASQARLDHLHAEHERLRHRTEEATDHLANLDLELRELTRADESLQERLAASRKNLIDQRQERDRLHRLADEQTQVLAEARVKRSGLISRIEVLEGLERTYEGLGTGVREMLGLLEQRRLSASDDDPWHTVLGLIAEFLTVRHEYAALIDLALGDRAQRFLFRDAEQLAQALRDCEEPFSGRVTFLPLREPTRVPESGADVANHAGVSANAADLVTCDHPELKDLPWQLLGNTLVVQDLDAARALWSADGGFRFVTIQGELLEANGSLTVGTHRAETGILSRKSELRELRQQVALLDERVDNGERNLVGLREHIGDLERHVAGLQKEIDVLAEQAADLRSRIGQRRERHEGLHEEVSLTQSEIHRIEADLQRLSSEWRASREQAEAADQEVQLLQARLDQYEREVRDRENQRQLRQQEVTAAKVALATVEERVAGLRAQYEQLAGDLGERREELSAEEQSIGVMQTRIEECQRQIHEATDVLSKSATEKAAAEERIAEFGTERDRLRQQRQELAARMTSISAEWRAEQEQAHTRELAANDVRHERDGLCERLRTDYQVELSELFRQTITPEPIDPAAVDEEIAELRRKLTRLGSVNLDSLQELAELETRSQSLQTQFDDLTSAKRSLEEIISTINADSRRLFSETFDTIRIHFQELFRKLFGGGMADIILENENDILESGIEIIARPPGKELRSISLMSGGEKTLTAVAILLAIFRSKPSPFCILDEVDAALDEANIGRFTAVLRDFLDRSQFIIVTHSKKTMAVADVLYGVTMQESGISKQVAVRFEDWVEDSPRPALSGHNGNGAGHPVTAGSPIH